MFSDSGLPVVGPSVDPQFRTDSTNIFTDIPPHGCIHQTVGCSLCTRRNVGCWTAHEANLHINVLELQAVGLALRWFWSHFRHHWIVLCSDNTTSMAYLRRQGDTVSPTLSLLAEQILKWTQDQDIQLTVEFIPGKLNVLADQLSRPGQVLPTEWTIAHSSLCPLWRLWGKPMVDLFATKYNARLGLYVSPIPDPQAYAQNAFCLDWSGLAAYAYPPTALSPRMCCVPVANRHIVFTIYVGERGSNIVLNIVWILCIPLFQSSQFSYDFLA